MAIETPEVDQVYQSAVARGLPIQHALIRQPWGHRGFCLREPNGLTLYLFGQE